MKRWHVADDDPGHSADSVSLRTMTCPHHSISLAGLDAKQGIQF
ncbi:MAG: hypothetical protein ACXWEQ_06945 [Halobacteriota archaeon]